MKNLPTELLRTFVTIVDNGGFTQAGLILGRSQPAISLQVKRLETLLETSIFDRSKDLQLTEEGQMLLGYSRKILGLNDAAVSRLLAPKVSGSVKLGIPNDFEVSFLPSTLSKFTQTYPDVTLEVSCDLSVNLQEEFKNGVYDLILVMEELEGAPSSDHLVEPLLWVASQSFIFNPAEPVPLILYPKGCVYRKHLTDTLNAADIPWRIVYCTPSLMGIFAAVESGLGISALGKRTVPATFPAYERYHDLPELGQVAVSFYYDKNELSEAAAQLLSYLRKALSSAPTPFSRSLMSSK
jgi:DNA-binding transcriptional LysR family regulator